MDNPGNNQHCNVLIWVGGRGGLRISTLCTIGKMLTIVNDPLREDIVNSITKRNRVTYISEDRAHHITTDVDTPLPIIIVPGIRTIMEPTVRTHSIINKTCSAKVTEESS